MPPLGGRVVLLAGPEKRPSLLVRRVLGVMGTRWARFGLSVNVELCSGSFPMKAVAPKERGEGVARIFAGEELERA